MKIQRIILALVILLNATSAMADLQRGLLAYERGDYHTALHALIPLGEAGDAYSQYILGRMFARGEGGVLQDYVEAYKWYNLAAARGQPLAAAARDTLIEKMSAEQIATAQALARDWRPLGRLPDPLLSPPLPIERRPTVPPPTTTLPLSAPSEPSSETLMALIQLNLKRLGYPIAQIDGRLSASTQAAIRDFQAKHNLAIDGQASLSLLQRLDAVSATEPPIRSTPPEEQAPPVEVEEAWRRLM